MKTNKKTLAALIASASFGLSGQAFAAFTAPADSTEAGTVISNQVNLDYTVNGIDQDAIDSTPVTFVVDTRVDFAVELNDSATVKVTPLGDNYVSTYALANYSNEALDFNLGAANIADGSFSFLAGTATDNFNITTLAVYVESGANTGYQPLEDTAVSINDLATYTQNGDEAILYVVTESAIAGTQVDADIAGVELTATALQGDGTAIPDQMDDADNTAEKQFVFADADNNGFEKLNTAFEVGSAKFTDPNDPNDANKFTMTVKVINDPICDSTLTKASTNDYSGGCPAGAPTNYLPKAIPGAMVEYTLTAKNSGSIDATAVTFKRDLADIADVDNDSNIDLVQDSLNAVDASTTNNTVTPVDSSTDNILDVTYSTVATDDVVTITFTAIVE